MRGRVGTGWAALVLAVAAACSGGGPAPVEPTGGDGTTTTATDATVVTDAEPGTGVLVLGPERFELEVESCATEPVRDDATGVTTELVVALTGGGLAVEVRRESFTTNVVTVTETVTVDTDGGDQLVDARRVDAAGMVLDLRAPDAAGRMIDRPDGTLVVVEGRFGTPGARGPAPDDLDGRLVLRCR